MDHELIAHNTATTSQNLIHDDDTARAFGFSGGLVPGVDVWAYLTHPAVYAWGLAFLEHGAMSARFAQPVYDGQRVTVHSRPDPPGRRQELELRNPAGDVCATGEAELPATPPEPFDPSTIPEVPLPSDLPPASSDALIPGTALGTFHLGFHAERADPYLTDIREDLALYREERIAHPGWLLRQANHVLAVNVALGPWIHTASTVEHLGVVRDGARIAISATVLDEYEQRGHRFVELDVRYVVDERVPVMRVRHQAIWLPRQVAGN